MFHKKTFITWLVFLPVILALTILAGCAAKLPIWGDPQTGLILKYRMAENQLLKYQLTIEQTQDIEVMGQQMKTETKGEIAFTAKSKGLKENNQQLGITIDSMIININSPQGEISPDMSSVEGKSFDMTMTTLGKELDLSGAESIQYDLGQAGTRDVGSNFQAVFPDLADRPVKVGDTWTSKDTINEKIGSGGIEISLESLNTLDGFEVVDGLECARITTKITGTLEGGGNQGGANLAFKGNIEGTETWHFAYKEGIFVKQKADIFTKGTVNVRGPQEMSIPLGQNMKIEVKLIK
ncbi:MAG: hypothetical protein GTO16_00425 [Candidatus Aminicenantes bacterium]|nr:hypothetical protein [Candidatus Aminicenantes bacterium]